MEDFDTKTVEQLAERRRQFDSTHVNRQTNRTPVPMRQVGDRYFIGLPKAIEAGRESEAA